MIVGDPIYYMQTCCGGYGFQRLVPGEFVRSTTKRIVVKLFRKSGEPVLVAVHPRNVVERIDGSGNGQ